MRPDKRVVTGASRLSCHVPAPRAAAAAAAAGPPRAAAARAERPQHNKNQPRRFGFLVVHFHLTRSKARGKFVRVGRTPAGFQSALHRHRPRTPSRGRAEGRAMTGQSEEAGVRAGALSAAPGTRGAWAPPPFCTVLHFSAAAFSWFVATSTREKAAPPRPPSGPAVWRPGPTNARGRAREHLETHRPDYPVKPLARPGGRH